MAAANHFQPPQRDPPQQHSRHVAPEYASFPPPPSIPYPIAMYDLAIAFYYPCPQHLPPCHMAGESYHSTFASSSSSSSATPMPVPYFPHNHTPCDNLYYYHPQGYAPPHHQQQPLMPPFLQGLPPPPPPQMNMAKLVLPCQKMADPEAKLFVGDLPMQMTTDEMRKELIEKFSFHGPCTVNVIWKSTITRVNEKPIPTGWIQYKNFIDANAALMWAKNEGFCIGNRTVRVERADGKRICRLYPSDPRAVPTLEDFKDIMTKFIHWTGKQKNKFLKFSIQYRIDIERVSITNDVYWRLPSVLPEHHRLLSLNGLGLDPSEVWRQDRQRLREQREDRHKLRLQLHERAEANSNNNNINIHGNGASDPCYDFVDKLPSEILRFPKQSAASRFNSRRGSSMMEKKMSYIIGMELRDICDPALESAFMV
ncbi:hypothetical protein UA08_01998 [Talaromyces atroroseus]|uniref:RRM domain-containing protein n=1 Tax=Talaromyces atroroseus TaxID=1441469 RepID=A0A1Q5QAF3_TALAT|nr:hypothetical protein UA08_01998 [Talaromyces atroroseus]OKL62912.1 hypothetical protein UA08_01998 [Talaromyces atroroseus]